MVFAFDSAVSAKMEEKIMKSSVLAAVGALSFVTANAFAAAIPVAEYAFNNNFNSSIGGAPALTAVDPLGSSGFRTDTVFGQTRTVYDFTGTTSAQSGLSLNVAGLLSSNSTYTVEMQFQFTERDRGWRRILDSQNRQSDNGFYVNTSNQLAVYPFAGASSFSNGAYHDVVLSNNNGVITFYLDGGAQNTITSNVMNISPANLLNFFLDNTVGGGAGEYSSGSVALIRVFDAALTGTDVGSLPQAPTAVPEPATLALLVPGLLAGIAARRRRAAKAA
jgi:hypothetical protein